MTWRKSLSGWLIPPLVLLTSITPAHAQNAVVPHTPENLENRQLWDSPTARPGESDSQLSVDLLSTSAPSHTFVPEGEEITFELRVKNNTEEIISGISITPQRADAAQSVPAARQLLAAPQFGFGYYAETLEIGSLDPGEQRDISITVATNPDAPSTFSIFSAGVYPILFAAMGTTPDGEPNQLLTTERTLLSIGQPGSAEAPPEAPPEGAVPEEGMPPEEGVPEEEEQEVPGLTLVYPITAEVDLLPGGTGTAPERPPLLLANENLATQLATGGRLDQLLNTYELHAPKESTCIALDPELIYVVDRMRDGYTVTSSRELPERPKRLRDSWGSGDEDVEKQPGGGSTDAQRWIDRLTDIAAQHCVIALPWANTDLNAVSATHNSWLAREALERGPTVLNQVLGTPGVTNTVITPAGWVTEDAAAIAGWADSVSSHLDQQSMSSTFEQSENNRWVAEPSEEVRVLIANNTVWDDAPSRFHFLRPNVTGVTYDASLSATLMAAGDVPAIAGYSNPDFRYDPALDSLQSRTLTAGHALHLATLTATDDILAMAPSAQSPEGAQVFLSTAQELIGTTAQGKTLEEYLHVDEMGPATDQVQYGTPFADPTVYTDTEITRATQQAYYTDGLSRILANSDNVALTPYGYTLPLRRDLLRAFSFSGRDGMHTFDEAVEKTNHTLATSGEMLAALRGSITLLPPGNVYTRTSESSPLLIVAENRLPLPVTARLAYENPQGGQLILPETVYIPAQGSITVSMTADLPEDADQTQIRLWLATPEEEPQAISSVVDITVQTRATTRDLFLLSLGIVAAFVAVLLIRRRRS